MMISKKGSLTVFELDSLKSFDSEKSSPQRNDLTAEHAVDFYNFQNSNFELSKWLEFTPIVNQFKLDKLKTYAQQLKSNQSREFESILNSHLQQIIFRKGKESKLFNIVTLIFHENYNSPYTIFIRLYFYKESDDQEWSVSKTYASKPIFSKD